MTIKEKIVKKNSLGFIASNFISHRYELADGQFREEEVIVLNKGTDQEEISVIGSYRYTGTDGILYEQHYTADKNGFVINQPSTLDIRLQSGVEFLPPQQFSINPTLIKSLLG